LEAGDELEYLLSYGLLGDFGRFRAAGPLHLGRGERAVIQTARGLEVGRVLRPATPRHALFLPNTTVGRLLRRPGPQDEAMLARLRQRSLDFLRRAGDLLRQLDLPLELLDAEILLDGQHAVLHYLQADGCDVRPFVSTLSREFEVHVLLQDLTKTAGVSEPEGEHHGCGREGCGRKAGGGCATCGSGGCGTCGSAQPAEVQAYFAGLREKMEQQRVSLI
jgi:hypothetical protein